ncbi:hypothetical protein SLE2022_336950 [Rubroshorea leprosula]
MVHSAYGRFELLGSFPTKIDAIESYGSLEALPRLLRRVSTNLCSRLLRRRAITTVRSTCAAKGAVCYGEDCGWILEETYRLELLFSSAIICASELMSLVYPKG